MPPENVFTAFKASTDGHVAPQWKRSNQPVTFDGVTKNYTLCTLEFFLPEDIGPPVLLYYQLTNFYQNHRRYVNSFNKEQLSGVAVDLGTVSGSGCQPLATWTNDSAPTGQPNRDKAIYPCGLIANSLFNDTFQAVEALTPANSSAIQPQPYSMVTTGIAWDSDKALYGKTSYNLSKPINMTNVVPPPNWHERYPNGYHDNVTFDPSNDEAFMVWMRTAGLPNFSKLAMRNDFDVMKSGTYKIEVLSRQYP
jgi:hypothetical protein